MIQKSESTDTQMPEGFYKLRHDATVQKGDYVLWSDGTFFQVHDHDKEVGEMVGSCEITLAPWNVSFCRSIAGEGYELLKGDAKFRDGDQYNARSNFDEALNPEDGWIAACHDSPINCPDMFFYRRKIPAQDVEIEWGQWALREDIPGKIQEGTVFQIKGDGDGPWITAVSHGSDYKVIEVVNPISFKVDHGERLDWFTGSSRPHRFAETSKTEATETVAGKGDGSGAIDLKRWVGNIYRNLVTDIKYCLIEEGGKYALVNSMWRRSTMNSHTNTWNGFHHPERFVELLSKGFDLCGKSFYGMEQLRERLESADSESGVSPEWLTEFLSRFDESIVKNVRDDIAPVERAVAVANLAVDAAKVAGKKEVERVANNYIRLNQLTIDDNDKLRDQVDKLRTELKEDEDQCDEGDECEDSKAEPRAGDKYLRDIQSRDGRVDVYDVLVAFDVACPARQHAIKKLLCAGLRGKGDEIQDLTEAVNACQRSVEIAEQFKAQPETSECCKKTGDSMSFFWDVVESHG